MTRLLMWFPLRLADELRSLFCSARSLLYSLFPTIPNPTRTRYLLFPSRTRNFDKRGSCSISQEGEEQGNLFQMFSRAQRRNSVSRGDVTLPLRR